MEMKGDETSITIRDRIKGLIRVRAEDLVPNSKKWRRHPKEQEKTYLDLLHELGIVGALIVRELPDGRLEIIDGHLRAGLLPDIEVPVLVLDVTAEEADKILLTFDPLSSMAEADSERLAALVSKVRSESFAIQELVRRTAGHRIWERAFPDETRDVELTLEQAEKLMLKWQTRSDQLWQAGPHRALCGDSTCEAVVGRLFGNDGQRFRMLATDPPYGVNYGRKNTYLNAIDRGNRVQRPIINDDRPAEAAMIFSSALRVATGFAAKGASCYAAVPGGALLPEFIAAFNQSGFSFKSLLIWLKNQFVIGRSDYQFRHENILYGWLETGPHYFVNDRTQDSVFEFDKPHASLLHSTQKPIALFERMIANSSRPGEIVFDPFGGSGTTLLAAHQLGRIGYACEIDPCYLAVILERLSELGLTPKVLS
jgi:DNA modification methylase